MANVPHQWISDSFRSMQAAGGMALRGLFVINSGAFVSTLGWYSIGDEPSKSLIFIISLFGLGAAIAVASACLSYNVMYSNHMLNWCHATDDPEGMKDWYRKRNKAHKWVLYFGWLSLAWFLGTLFLLLLSQVYTEIFHFLYNYLLSILNSQSA